MGRHPLLGLAVCCGLLTVASHAWASGGVIPVKFDSGRSQAFVVAGSGAAISVGARGFDLQSARLGSSQLKPRAVDTVSRLIVFPATEHAAMQLAQDAKPGQQLKSSTGSLRVDSWVEHVGGNYLPFSLLKLRHDGRAPELGEPLLDGSNRVAAIAYQSAGQGVLYAIPSTVVQRTLEAARRGTTERAWLGVVMDPKLALPKVVRIVPGSPAAQAGLQAGDVILELNGSPIRDYGDAVHAFFLLQIGTEVSLKFRRGSDIRSTGITPKAPRA